MIDRKGIVERETEFAISVFEDYPRPPRALGEWADVWDRVEAEPKPEEP